MRILLTNGTLDSRAGSELYARDVALALLARGHQPLAYSRHLGAVAVELRRNTVPVVDDLDSLGRPPDLIHAHHHLEAMTALSRFPHVPAIYVCHGWLPAEEAPPVHPRIRRYVAVDELVRQRLVDECGIDPSRIATLLNFVDLQRFPPRDQLPARPARALAFSNYLSEADGLPILRRACADQGLEFEAVGERAGKPLAEPEQVLGDYDVVFAKARAAMEALAVGCAVILCDTSGLGPLVTAEDLDRLRRLNFGVRLLRQPITVEGVVDRLRRYDADDAAAVSQRMRQIAGLDRYTEQLLDLYDEVLSEHASTHIEPEEEARAVSRYLRHGPLGADFAQYERSRYEAELTRTRCWAESLASELETARAAKAEWQSDLREEVRGEREHFQAELARRERESDDLRRELAWMRESVTWRWRARLLRMNWLRRLYRALRGRTD